MTCSLCSPVQWFSFSQAHVVWCVLCWLLERPAFVVCPRLTVKTFTSVRWDTCGTATWELGIHPCGPFKLRMRTSGVCSQINLCCENASGVCCRPQLSVIFPWTSRCQMWRRCSVPMERWHLLCPSLRIVLEGRWSRVGPVKCCNGKEPVPAWLSPGLLLGMAGTKLQASLLYIHSSWFAWSRKFITDAFCGFVLMKTNRSILGWGRNILSTVSDKLVFMASSWH